MEQLLETDHGVFENLERISQQIQLRLSGRVRNFHLVVCDDGLVLRGHAPTYYAKQLALQAVWEITSLPIRANEIEVSRRCGRDDYQLDG